MKYLGRCSTLIMGATFVAVAATPALAERTIRLSLLDPIKPYENTMSAAAVVFKQMVESQSNGEIKVELFPAGQLGKDSEIVQQVRDGVIESHIASVGGTATHYQLIDVLNVPFAYPDIATTYKVLGPGPFFDAIASDIRAKTDLQLLAFNDNGGFMHVTNSKHPVTSLADFEALRIRTMTLSSHETAMQSLGADTVPIPWAELYSALQTGVVDGQMNPIPLIASAHFEEVQEYLTLTGHLFSPHVWVMNGEFYDSLSDDERRIVEYAVDSARTATQGIARIIESTEDGLPLLASKMEVSALSAEDRAAMRDRALPAVSNLIEEQYGAEGVELLNLFLEQVKEASR